MTKPIEPLNIETYEDIKKMKESNYDYWDKEDHSRYVEAKLTAKINELIAHSQEQDRIINSLIKKYEK